MHAQSSPVDETFGLNCVIGLSELAASSCLAAVCIHENVSGSVETRHRGGSSEANLQEADPSISIYFIFHFYPTRTREPLE